MKKSYPFQVSVLKNRESEEKIVLTYNELEILVFILTRRRIGQAKGISSSVAILDFHFYPKQ